MNQTNKNSFIKWWQIPIAFAVLLFVADPDMIEIKKGIELLLSFFNE